MIYCSDAKVSPPINSITISQCMSDLAGVAQCMSLTKSLCKKPYVSIVKILQKSGCRTLGLPVY